MRRPILILLILLFPAFTACSYSTAFVVVNDSDHPIEVRYKVNRDAGVLSSTDTPAKIAASQVANRYRAQWRNLSPAEYQTSKNDRTITVIVNVMPHEALWVTTMFHYVGDEDPNDVASWPIDEISLAGTNGGMTFTGQKARKSFSYVSRLLYTLTYK
jgi:hypothetical protein